MQPRRAQRQCCTTTPPLFARTFFRVQRFSAGKKGRPVNEAIRDRVAAIAFAAIAFLRLRRDRLRRDLFAARIVHVCSCRCTVRGVVCRYAMCTETVRGRSALVLCLYRVASCPPSVSLSADHRAFTRILCGLVSDLAFAFDMDVTVALKCVFIIDIIRDLSLSRCRSFHPQSGVCYDLR